MEPPDARWMVPDIGSFADRNSMFRIYGALQGDGNIGETPQPMQVTPGRFGVVSRYPDTLPEWFASVVFRRHITVTMPYFALASVNADRSECLRVWRLFCSRLGKYSDIAFAPLWH
jgi:hypothetical protein